ncbi:unnamed protein product [Peronospora belbahrii]|uniref:Poly(A) RNA polymerase mitochondrial-like central palm domain-containing protein n=1 Tax=Peronospora belbahrii TaxID=622444 RepID=A0AAU9KP25_9STRA|nr:unnamed protein product [Peronospora belbahrii]CAH0520655.1 unnamed protein product [Peronospora belbahrii]
MAMRRHKKRSIKFLHGSTIHPGVSMTHWKNVEIDNGASLYDKKHVVVNSKTVNSIRNNKRRKLNIVEPNNPDKTFISSRETAMDAELKLFADQIALSAQERELRTKVFEDVRDLILSSFQDATVQLYGSSSTGLDTFRSDLDITVGNITLGSLSQHLPTVVLVDEEEEGYGKLQQQKGAADAHLNVSGSGQAQEEETSFSLNLALPVGITASVDNAHITRRGQPTAASHWNPTLRRRKIRVLRALQILLKSQRPHFQVKCLHKAKIPILMVLDTKTKLAIDIGVNRELFEVSEHGRSTILAKKLQSTLGAPFTTIIMFLKEFLHQYELDKPFTGGLGSFRLYMMVAFIFRRCVSKRKNKARPPVSSLLLTFFELFGNKKQPKFLHENTQLPLPFGYGGHMSFGGVFRIDDCVETFAMAFDILSSTGNIGSIIYEDRLEEDRKKCQKSIDQCVKADRGSPKRSGNM